MSQPYICNTFSFIWKQPFRDCIPHLTELGFDQFEVLLTAPHLWPADCDAAQRRAIVRQLESSGARVVSLNAGGFDNNLASPGANVRAFAQQYLRDTIDLAADLGAGDVVIGPGMGRGLLPPSKDAMLGWLREGLEMLAQHAESRNVRLLLENVPFSFIPRVDQMMAAIEGLPPERVGIVYDVANAVFVREDPVEGLKTALSRVRLVHLSDTPLDVWRHDPVGRGIVPFDRFLSALHGLNCPAPVVLEIISDSPEQDIVNSASALTAMGYGMRDRASVLD